MLTIIKFCFFITLTRRLTEVYHVERADLKNFLNCPASSAVRKDTTVVKRYTVPYIPRVRPRVRETKREKERERTDTGRIKTTKKKRRRRRWETFLFQGLIKSAVVRVRWLHARPRQRMVRLSVAFSVTVYTRCVYEERRDTRVLPVYHRQYNYQESIKTT